jgi:hypothetical protein
MIAKTKPAEQLFACTPHSVRKATGVIFEAVPCIKHIGYANAESYWTEPGKNKRINGWA